MTVFVGIAVLVLVLLVLAFWLSASRRIRRYGEHTQQSARLVNVELERRYEQLGPFVAAAEDADLDPQPVRQLVGARSWSKAVRERAMGLPAQAAAENALSAAFHAVLAEAEVQANLLGNWAFQGPAGDLAVTEQRIAGAIRVYNDNAFRLSQAIGSFPTSLVAKTMSVPVPEPFVETKPGLDEEQRADVAGSVG